MDLKLTRPGFWMGALLALMVVGVQTIVSVPLATVDELFVRLLQLPAPRLAQNPIMVSAVNLIAFSGAIAVGLALNRVSFWKAFEFKAPKPSVVIAMIAVVLGGDVLLSEADNLFRMIFPPPEFLREAFKQLFTNEGSLLPRVFLLVVVAPLTEELLFRGIILRGLLSRYHPLAAIGLTALLFGAVHVNPWQFISAFWLGVAFGWFYVRTGSIVICMLAHGFSNGLFVLLSALPIEISGLTTEPEFGHVEFQPWWLDLAGFALLIIGIAVFWFLSRTQPKAPRESAFQSVTTPGNEGLSI